MAWLASALVHGALLLLVRQGRWVWTRPDEGSQVPLELEVVDVTPVPAPLAPATRPPEPKMKSRGPGARPSIVQRAPPPAVLPAEQGPRPAPPPASVPEAPPPEREASPPPALMRTRPAADAVAPPAPPGPAGAGDVRLSLDDLSPMAQKRLGLVGPAPAGAAPERAPRISADRLRIARERDEDAVANVRAGRVDPFLHQFVRDARARFEEGARGIADQLPLGTQKTAETWVHGYAARVAETNAQIAAARNGARRESDVREGETPERPIERRPDVLGAYGEATRAADAGAVERHVTVCLTVAPGRDTIVTVKRESRDPALDQLAREAFTRAAAVRPVPADAHAATACYDLSIRAFRIPPLPVISCGIDKHGPTCTWPLKKVTSVKVHLESVDYAGDAPQHPSLLRRPH